MASASNSYMIKVSEFGTTPDSRLVKQYTLTNSKGVSLDLIDYGATIRAIRIPIGDSFRDLVLGYDTLEGYLENPTYFGCTVGRVANRIAGACFTLDGEVYKLEENHPGVQLHGGFAGLHKVLFDAELKYNAVSFSHKSPDGTAGYPGDLTIKVTFTLTEDSEILIEYTATTNKATPVNLTNHSYFNLQGAGDIKGHAVHINSTSYTELNDQLVTTGKIIPTTGGPRAFNKEKNIGQDIEKVGVGFDINYCLLESPKSMKFPTLRYAATVKYDNIALVVYTDKPGVQFYTGNFLSPDVIGKGSQPCLKHGAFCLETQDYPNAVNRPEFPSIILKPGETYLHNTVYQILLQSITT